MPHGHAYPMSIGQISLEVEDVPLAYQEWEMLVKQVTSQDWDQDCGS